MNTFQHNLKYIEWQSAEDIHNTSKQWLSELEFIKDEHLFFSDLITTFTLQLINPEHFAKNKALINKISRSIKRNNQLIDEVKTHENDLKILVDGINQIEKEKAYIKRHKSLLTEIGTFLENYKSLKFRLFNLIKTIKKEEKRIIDKP